jgi:hypothetical protein
MNRREQLAVLDAVLTQRVRWLPERRLNARMTALSKFFQMGGNPLDVSLSEGEPDLFDVAGPLGDDFAASHMLDYLSDKASGKAKQQGALVYTPVDEGA